MFLKLGDAGKRDKTATLAQATISNASEPAANTAANWLIMTTLAGALLIAFPELYNSYLMGTSTSIGSIWLLGAIFVVMATAILIFFITWLCQYIIFQQTSPSLSAALSESEVTQELNDIAGADTEEGRLITGVGSLHVTGEFVLDEKTQQRFSNAPAVMKIFSTGDVALFSKIDASSTFYKTIMLKQRVGIWYLVMRHNSLRLIEPGNLYFGWNTRPALRVYFTDAFKPKPAMAVLSFSDEIERATVIAELMKTAALLPSTAA